MIILVDMDDTIELLLEAWLERVNTLYDRNVTAEEIIDWDVSKAYPGLTKNQVYDVILENDFWKTVKPIPGAIEGLRHFISTGHEVYLVTATPYESVTGKMRDHIFRYFPFISWDHIIITANKQLLKGDILIDDGVHNLEGGDYTKILVDAPYNRSYDADANGMIRVHNWEEIICVVDRISSPSPIH